MYNDLYSKAINEIDTLLFSLHNNSLDDECKEVSNRAIDELQGYRSLLEKNLLSLNVNSDWNKFNIAFYGETNAGKSTMIETLRILLNEPTKKIQRDNYQIANEQREKAIADLDVVCKEIDSRESLKVETEQQIEAQREETYTRIGELEDEWIYSQLILWELNRQILEIMASGISGFLKVLFRKTEKQIQAMRLSEDIKRFSSNYETLNKTLFEIGNRLQTNQNEYFTRSTELNRKKEQLFTAIKEYENTLRDLSDGAIIGAQTDFTRSVTSYDFSVDGVNFAILDLPGIEGKEDLVQEEIKKAVEKAHCVLYMSRKPKAPQKGDGERKGTIEKIAQHLSGQSEVYFVYNKSIKNLTQLNDELETPDILSGLDEVDKRMKEAIPDNYIGHATVSAYPGFISISNSFNDSYAKSKGKFLKEYTSDEILSKSGLLRFREWLVTSLISNHKKKIIKSNFKKIRIVNEDTLGSIRNYKLEFEKIEKEVLEDIGNVQNQIEELEDGFLKSVDSIVRKETRNFINRSRKETFDLIEKGINNKSLTSDFKNLLQRNDKILEDNIGREIDKVADDFKKDASAVVEKHCKYIDELLRIHSVNNGYKFDYSFKISVKAKGKIIGILVSIASFAAYIILGPDHGIVPLILSAISLLLSVAKEILAFFDTDYKIEQQKKSINDRLNKISKELDERSSQLINDLEKEISLTTGQITDELQTTTKKIKVSICAFQRAEDTLVEQLKWLERKEIEFYGDN